MKSIEEILLEYKRTLDKISASAAEAREKARLIYKERLKELEGKK